MREVVILRNEVEKAKFTCFPDLSKSGSENQERKMQEISSLFTASQKSRVDFIHVKNCRKLAKKRQFCPMRPKFRVEMVHISCRLRAHLIHFQLLKMGEKSPNCAS